MHTSRTIVGILVGGGPAPGINSVISAVTIRSIFGGCDVVGILDGFKWLMEGSTSQVRPLSIEGVSRIHFRGGSYLGTSRANPTKTPESLANVLSSLVKLGITRLVTIGGDDTAFSSLKLEEQATGRIHIVHVPKTIDNDLDLPAGIPTFGFQTARHVAVEIVKNLMVDAHTTSRWYFVVTMGRKAGHLALGIGKAAGATLTVIPEEFGERPVRLQRLVDLVIGTMIKRLSGGRADGVVVLAEGLIEILDPRDLGGLDHVERDEHGHLRFAEVDIGDVLRREVTKGMTSLGTWLRRSSPRMWGMNYAVRTRFRSIWNTPAISAIARRSSCLMEARRPWCRFRMDGLRRFLSSRWWIPSAAARKCGWWISRRSRTRLRASI